jgi:peptidase E
MQINEAIARLKQLFACAFALVIMICIIVVPPAAAQEEMPTRRILAIGGGTYTGNDQPLPRYLLALTGKKNPVVYLLPTAAGDSPVGVMRWYEVMNDLECRPRHLRLFHNSAGLKNMKANLLAADAIFVGGGNTMNMLAVWKAHGVDVILRNAWERGVVLAGESAGMICWFEQGVTDSRPDKLTSLECLGFLKGSACPHYDNEVQRKPAYHKMLLSGEAKAGVACNDGAALLFEGDQFVRAVAVNAKARAYRVRRDGMKVVEEPLNVELLGAKK